jgi:hypothetical protein
LKKYSRFLLLLCFVFGFWAKPVHPQAQKGPSGPEFLQVKNPQCPPGKDPKTGYEPYLKEVIQKANSGDSHFQALLGRIYFEGLFIKDGKRMIADHQEAYRWLNKALLKNHPIAHYYTGQFYYRNELQKKSLSQSQKWFNRAQLTLKDLAKKGSPDAQILLGHLYREKLAQDQNLERAKFWYCQAVKQGDPRAMYFLGHLFAPDFFSKKSDKRRQEGLFLISQAAKQNEFLAQNFLGHYYSNLEKFEQSRFWLEKAAQNHHAQAQYQLGVLILGKKIPEKHDYEAFKWLVSAAELNNRSAQTLLARHLFQGDKIPHNPIEAMKWLLIVTQDKGFSNSATKNDANLAQGWLNELRRKSTSEDWHKAKRLAEDWLPAYLGGQVGP